MNLNNTPKKLFTPEQANTLATSLTAQDTEGWTYKANHDPKGTGYSFIEIYDESGAFVACLT